MADITSQNLEVVGKMQSPLLSPVSGSADSYVSNPQLLFLSPGKSEGSLSSNRSTLSTDSLECSDETFTSYVSKCRRHPWGLIDYHEYLGRADINRKTQQDRNECHLVELDGIKGVFLDNNINFDNIEPGTTPEVLFMNLPIPQSDKSTFGKLFLGFDLKSHNLVGYLFLTDSVIENYHDLWLNWKRGIGQKIINIPLERLLEVVGDVMTSNIEVLEIGILHHYAATTKPLPRGIELVVVIQFLQFIDDCADLIWPDGNEMGEMYRGYQEDMRDIIASGSSAAWFAGRDEVPLETFRQKHLRKVAGAALWYGQKVADRRDEVDNHLAARERYHDHVFTERLVWFRRLLWSLILIMLVLGLGFLWYLLSSVPWSSVFEWPFEQKEELNILSLWPFEWETQQKQYLKWFPSKHDMLKSLPFRRDTRTPELFEWIPFIREAHKMSIFGWTPFKQEVQNTGLLAWFPFLEQMQKMGTIFLWPFKQQTRSIEKSGWLSFNRQVQKASLFGWWPSKQVAQKAGKLGWLSFNRQVKQVKRVGRFELSFFRPKKTQLSALGPFGSPFKR
jgi:hypothetical protein